MQCALKSKSKNRDDITVIVVDAMPSASDRMPVRLQKDGGGHTVAASFPTAPVMVHRLLDAPQAAPALQQAIW